MYSVIHFSISPEEMQTFARTFLLSLMHKEAQSYDVLLPGDQEYLHPTLIWLQMKELVEINNQHRYTLTQSGTKKAANFAARYRTLLTYFDLFSAVDLSEGTFAFEKIGDFPSTSAWKRYLNDERWEDLRIPIIEHLGGSALELVYCQFVQENRLTSSNTYWPLEMNAGTIWAEILEICNSSIKAIDLAYPDESNDGSTVSGEAILDDIAEQGFILLRELHPSDTEIHSNLQAWYPLKDKYNHDLPVPLPGWKNPIWQTPWSLD